MLAVDIDDAVVVVFVVVVVVVDGDCDEQLTTLSEVVAQFLWAPRPHVALAVKQPLV